MYNLQCSRSCKHTQRKEGKREEDAQGLPGDGVDRVGGLNMSEIKLEE